MLLISSQSTPFFFFSIPLGEFFLVIKSEGNAMKKKETHPSMNNPTEDRLKSITVVKTPHLEHLVVMQRETRRLQPRHPLHRSPRVYLPQEACSAARRVRHGSLYILSPHLRVCWLGGRRKQCPTRCNGERAITKESS